MIEAKTVQPVPNNLQPANLHEAQMLIARLQDNLRAGFNLQVTLASDCSIMRTRCNDLEAQLKETDECENLASAQVHKLNQYAYKLERKIEAALRCKSVKGMRMELERVEHE